MEKNVYIYIYHTWVTCTFSVWDIYGLHIWLYIHGPSGRMRMCRSVAYMKRIQKTYDTYSRRVTYDTVHMIHMIHNVGIAIINHPFSWFIPAIYGDEWGMVYYCFTNITIYIYTYTYTWYYNGMYHIISYYTIPSCSMILYIWYIWYILYIHIYIYIYIWYKL